MVAGERIARYGFGDGHPFGPDRHEAFLARVVAQGLDKHVRMHASRASPRATNSSLSTPEYVDCVAGAPRTGEGYLDGGDTPAFAGVFEAAATSSARHCVAAEQ